MKILETALQDKADQSRQLCEVQEKYLSEIGKISAHLRSLTASDGITEMSQVPRQVIKLFPSALIRPYAQDT
eukprot:37294-Eustigmatos_ZCMA.PRE.1